MRHESLRKLAENASFNTYLQYEKCPDDKEAAEREADGKLLGGHDHEREKDGERHGEEEDARAHREAEVHDGPANADDLDSI